MPKALRVSHLTAAALAATAAWSAAAEPALAYIDPTAAGAFLQSSYVILASLVLFIAAVPHKVSAFLRGVKARFAGKAKAPTADQER